MVFDVLRAPALERAEGEAQEPVDGLPTVELAENGAPTITIPEGEDAPKELEIVPLIEGDGAEVGETDSVYLHYTGVVWSSGKEFDSSWTNGTPIMLPANQFVPGFTKAITGQKVGSQILAVIPADEGYAEATAERLAAADATEDDVMVFVVDILDAIPAQETADAEEDAE
nr:FKBP-type peptidyl-prolyl cis-trans isomerase [Leucobacter weissii]